jgi:hypothetical protein
METEHTETVVDKAVAFVKDMFGVHPDPTPEVRAKGEYSDTAPEITAKDAVPQSQILWGPRPARKQVRLDNEMDRAGETERVKREADGHPQPKGAFELMAESARREDDG